MRFTYTEQQLLFLRNGCTWMAIGKLTAAFNQQFGLEKTEKAIRSAMKNNKITGGRHQKSGIRRRTLFTTEQSLFVQEMYKRYQLPEVTSMVNEKYGLAVRESQLRAFFKNNKILSGRNGRFPADHTPWNAGTKGTVSCHKNSGSFVKGNIPANIRPIGAERICSKDGFVLVKIEEVNPYTGAKTRFKHKHVVVWEEHNGPVPEGMVIRLLDGDQENCSPDNLLLVTRAEHLRLTQLGITNYPEDLRPSVVAIARLEVKSFQRQRGGTK